MANNEYIENHFDCLEFVKHLTNFIGRTITIFTVSSGNSSLGFTGVLLSVNNNMISLVTQVGSAPELFNQTPCNDEPIKFQRVKMNYPNRSRSVPIQSTPIKTNLGSITDIPIDKIVAVVHNAV